MIYFQNKGELDIRAIKTMGVNVKETESAIGYFGTGLKYAIAVLLREGCNIRIFTGGKGIEFYVTRQEIRGKEFDIVSMSITDGATVRQEELGFTTQLGKNWKVWMAYRELYSNALDENGMIGECADDYFTVDKNETIVLVDGKKFEDVHNMRWKYFARERGDKPVASFNGLDIYKSKNQEDHKGIFFYKGVKVGDTYLPCDFDFDFTGIQMSLTEDRTLAYGFQARWAVCSAFFALLPEQKKAIELFENFLVAEPNTFENSLNYMESYSEPNDLCLDIIGELRNELQDCDMNTSAIMLHAKHRKRSVLPTESVKLTSIQQAQLDRAKAFLTDTLGYDMSLYPLIVAHNLGDGVLGRADIEQKILYLATGTFGQGTKRVAAALVEEFVHVHYKVHDETLEQKMVYLEKILSMGEEIEGVPL